MRNLTAPFCCASIGSEAETESPALTFFLLSASLLLPAPPQSRCHFWDSLWFRPADPALDARIGGLPGSTAFLFVPQASCQRGSTALKYVAGGGIFFFYVCIGNQSGCCLRMLPSERPCHCVEVEVSPKHQPSLTMFLFPFENIFSQYQIDWFCCD